MEAFFGSLPLQDLGVVAVMVSIALLVIGDKLVWHSRLDKAEARADRWEGIALRALGVAETVTATAQVVADAASDAASDSREGR